MAKKSKKHSSRHERDPAGCIWGFINIFDLRHGRPTKMLLAGRKRVRKQAVGAEPSRIETIAPGLTEIRENEVDAEENKMPVNDVARISVKELMEEEMFDEERLTNKSKGSEICLEKIDQKNGLVKKNHRRNRRISSKSTDMDAAPRLMPEYFQTIPGKITSNNLDLEAIVEQLIRCNQSKLNQNDLDKPSIQAVTAVDEKLVAAIKLYLEQRMSRSQNIGEDEKPCCSKELADALRTLSSNKGLFLKLLKDPDSVIVADIEKLEIARLEEDQTLNCVSESSLSQDKPVQLSADGSSKRKFHNFFRRRSKSLDSLPVMKDDDSQSSRKIVILKPGPAAASSPETDIAFSSMSSQWHDMENDVHGARTSQFSFSEIKRKLRNAMGKERQGINQNRFSLKPKNINSDKGENLVWSSPNRNHFYTERFAKSLIKKAELADRSKEDGSTVVSGASNIYVEAKKHLSEILNNGEEKAQSMNRQLPKSLGRILAFPEYNSSPCGSPKKQGDGIFLTAQMRLSPHGTVKKTDYVLLLEDQSVHPDRSGENLESETQISFSDSEDHVQDPNTNDNIPLTHDQECFSGIRSLSEDSSSRVVEIEEAAELRQSPEEQSVLDNDSQSSSNSFTIDIQSDDMILDNKESTSQCVKESSGLVESGLSGEYEALSSPAVSPSHSSRSREVDDLEGANDKMERPSPVSVLEPLFTDEEISPAKSITHTVDREIQPLQIHFGEQSSSNDQGICTRISLEDEESAFEYVEAVLLGSGLNWDEFLLRWLSYCEILESSLFDEVELFSSRSHDDQKLLFDTANEALKEVCENYFGYFAISPAKHKMMPVLKGMDLIQEVWHSVEWHLLQNTRPHSLDKLVRRDMECPGKWMNLRYDFEDIGLEMGDGIFEELVVDTLTSFLDDSTYHDFETHQADPNIIEETNA